MDQRTASRAPISFAEKEAARLRLTASGLSVAEIVAARDAIEAYHRQQPAHARGLVRAATLEAISEGRSFWTLRERAPYVRWDGRMSAWGL